MAVSREVLKRIAELEAVYLPPPVAPLPDFDAEMFPEQLAFVNDPARLKALLCTRRSGKTYGGAGIALCKKAFEIPGSTLIYFGLTRESAKRIIYRKILFVINEKLRLGGVWNKSDLSMTFPNGSVIYVLGADSNETEIEKAFGQKVALAVIDEAALYTISLDNLIYSVLQPSVSDEQGTICLIGMPSDVKMGTFYRVTKGQKPMEPGRWTFIDKDFGAIWSGHRWSAFQNPRMAKIWQKEIDDKMAVNPLIAETPLFTQEYLGEWVVDDTKLVYRYSATRNAYDGRLPSYPEGSWHYGLGCDLGFKDDTSFTVVAWHDHDDKMYIVQSDKHPAMDLTDVANHIKALDATFDFDFRVVDGANLQGVEEMRRRHSLSLESAEKQDKWTFIRLMNAELIKGMIKVNTERCAPLIKEWQELIKNPKSAKDEEHPGLPNHCSDSANYGWRRAYAYLSERLIAPPLPGTREAAEAEARRLLEARMLQLHIEKESQGDYEW